MLNILGKYNQATIHTDQINNETIRQIYSMLNNPCLKNNKIEIMPDCHAGKDCVIGTTMTLHDTVIPSLVGADINCGMLVVQIAEPKETIDFNRLDQLIRKKIPYGYSIHKDSPKNLAYLKDLRCPIQSCTTIERSLGTLGGGNHFIELDTDGTSVFIVIHSGSRNLGTECSAYYQKLAQKPDSSREAACLTGQEMIDYLHDIEIVGRFAKENRNTMMNIILEGMNFTEVRRFETVHNYIDPSTHILRKGSVSAQKDEILIIPINMREGSLICKGKGNPEWNFSAPHGAGRIMSRRQAKETIKLEDYKEAMSGIFTTCVSQQTIDESPFAYKSIEDIVDNIDPTVEILDIITPIYNFKAS